MQLSFVFGTFARHLMAYCLSEAAAKASRLVVVVTIARTMDATMIGVAAAALAGADIFKSLTENGIGQRIIAAEDFELDAKCRTAHRLFWIWCLGLFVAQMGVGACVLMLTGDVTFFILFAVLAGEFLFMPAGLVQCALAMRAGKMRQTAAIAGGQIVGANLACAALALVFPGPLALVLPRLIAAPIWLIAQRRLHPWSPDRGCTPAPLRPFIRYGSAVLGVELVRALRLQGDKLVVGALLGAEALGLYFMAFNAGLGIANSFSQALSTVLFPHLCQARDRIAALRRAILLSLGAIAPVVILQSVLAPVYVPFLLGPDWQSIGPVVSILCLAAIPAVIWSAAAQWLRVQERPQAELAISAMAAVALVANTALMAPFGLTAVAWGYLGVALLTQVGGALPTLAMAFRPMKAAC